MFHFRSSKLFIVVLIVMILATSAYAFAANLTITASNAGEGTQVIGGYAVTAVSYTYSSANPSLITFVDFDIAPATTKASVGFNGANLTDCIGGGSTITPIAGGSHVHCAVSQGVQAATQLRIVASD